jgi:hypothetical protein
MALTLSYKAPIVHHAAKQDKHLKPRSNKKEHVQVKNSQFVVDFCNVGPIYQGKLHRCGSWH